MAHDILHIECPNCPESLEVWTYTGPNKEIDFSLDDAPLRIIKEIQRASDDKGLICPCCRCHVTLNVKYLVYATKSDTSSRIKLVWRDNL